MAEASAQDAKAAQDDDSKEEEAYIDIRHRDVISRALQFHGLTEYTNSGTPGRWQPLYLNKKDGNRPFVPGTIVQRSDLPSYFASSLDECMDPQHPDVLLLQDIYHVDPKSADEHIEFARDFASAKATREDIKDALGVSSQHPTNVLLKRSMTQKRQFDKMGPLKVTGFGGEAQYNRHGVSVMATSQDPDEKHNRALNYVLWNNLVLAVFQCQDTWPTKGTDGSAAVAVVKNAKNHAESALARQRFMFLGYYTIRSAAFARGTPSEIADRFKDYPNFFEVLENGLGTSQLGCHFYEFELKRAFSYEIMCENAINKCPYEIIFSLDGDRPCHPVKFPAKALLEIQEKMFPGLDHTRPRAFDDFLPRYSAGETDLLDTLRQKIIFEYLAGLSNREFKAVLQSMQPETDNMRVRLPAGPSTRSNSNSDYEEEEDSEDND